MSEQTSQEPTMEEILASIRRIISEDDAPAGVAATAPEDEPDYAEVGDDGHGDPAEAFEGFRQPEPEPEPELAPPVAAPAPAAVAAPTPPSAPEPQRSETLVSPQTASAAASAFGHLSSAVSQPRENRSLEDLAREMLQPMLRQWLDQNLERIVQAAVRDEVERISRRVG